MDEKKEAELARLKQWGSVPAEGDLLGAWLMSVLHGKRETYLIDGAGKEVEGEPAVPGVYEIGTRSGSMPDPFTMGGGCCFEISLQWDQWVRCVIRCTHGEWEGTSDWFNVTEAVMRAAIDFNTADHPEKEEEQK
jgi:hypothetical protein